MNASDPPPMSVVGVVSTPCTVAGDPGGSARSSAMDRLGVEDGVGVGVPAGV